MKQIPLFLFLFGALVLCSCRRSLPPREYVNYVENPSNGLLLSQKSKGVYYTLQFQPTDYVVMLELKSFSIPSETYKIQYDRFKDLEHYVFRIGRRDIDSLVSKSKDTVAKKSLLPYLNFKIQKDIKLIEGTDTVPCAIAQCESNFGMTPYYTIVLGFKANEYSGDREFLFTNTFLNSGNIKIMVSGSKIKRIPKLKLS